MKLLSEVKVRLFAIMGHAFGRRSLTTTRPPMGRWLIDNMPRGEPLDLPNRRDPPRAIPFDRV